MTRLNAACTVPRVQMIVLPALDVESELLLAAAPSGGVADGGGEADGDAQGNSAGRIAGHRATRTFRERPGALPQDQPWADGDRRRLHRGGAADRLLPSVRQ